MRNPENYLNHSLNKSSTKQACTFSRSSRFKTEHSKLDKFYDLPSMRTRRVCGLGIGNKVPIFRKSISPPPGTYDIGSEFNKQGKKTTFTFGKGRAEILFNDFLGMSKKVKGMPGPNHYRIKNSTLTNRGGRIGERLQTEIEALKKRNGPGPGAYRINGTTISHPGSYFLSTIRNQSSPKYHNQSMMEISNRLSSTNKKLGPGACNSITKVDKNHEKFGKSLLSKFRNSICSSFAKSNRPSLEDSSKRDIPACHYRGFSEFGLST